MATQPTGDEDWPGYRRGDLHERRERERRRIRRRRLMAAVALVAGVLAIVAVAVSGVGGGGGKKEARSSAAERRAAAKRRASAKVTNATPQTDWGPHLGPVPILEYHGLGQAPEGAEYSELYVGRSDFSRQMDWLDSQGYEAVTLEQVERAWYHDGVLPPKPIVLSFDDGYRPQFTFALPELRKHGWAGVLNLRAEGSDLYTSNVEAMIRAGWELASHTINHLDLTTLEEAQLQEEVAGSRQMLQREYHVPVKNFCYPSGAYDETVIAAVEAAGYVGATTENAGYATRERPYELDRYGIVGSSGVSGVAADLASGRG